MQQSDGLSDRDSRLDTRRIAEVVRDTLAGDEAATVEFFLIAAPRVRSIVLRAFRESAIWVDPDRMHDIVNDGVLELIRAAPSWRPDGGAAPWTWARARLVAIAYAQLGVFADDLDSHDDLEQRSDPAPDHHPVARDALDRLATQHPLVSRLAEALDRVASERDGHVWVDLLVEEAGGNRRAAVTVAQQHDISHANARKIRQRVQRGLVSLSDDPEFRELAGLPVLCA